MPTNKNAMTRYKILDELLSNQYHDYSLNDLTEEVNRRLEECGQSVSRRMIEKDIHYLEYEGPFQVLMKRYRKNAYDYDKKKTVTKQCLRYETPKFSIFSKTISDDEEYLIGEALSLLGQFDGSFGKELIVLEPEYIYYNKVRERISEMIEEYGKLRT